MVKINENYQKLPGSYLFSEVARRISVYSAAHPEARIDVYKRQGLLRRVSWQIPLSHMKDRWVQCSQI